MRHQYDNYKMMCVETFETDKNFVTTQHPAPWPDSFSRRSTPTNQSTSSTTFRDLS